MTKITWRNEAENILEIIQKYFPKHFEAKASIKWLKEYSTQARQTEWVGFFFEKFSIDLLEKTIGGWSGVPIRTSAGGTSRIDYIREYNWDMKAHVNTSVKARKRTEINIQTQEVCQELIINRKQGLGFIIASIDAEFDKNGSLAKWHKKFVPKNKPNSKKNERKKKQGPHIMKTKASVTDYTAVFIANSVVLKDGIKKKWIIDFNQGPQPSGASRVPKYSIVLDKVPEKHRYDIKLN